MLERFTLIPGTMAPPVLWYGTTLFVTGLICLVLALQIFLFLRQSPGAIALGLLLVALSWWDITYALYWIDAPAPNAQFWVDVTYVGVVSAPTLVFIFAIQISGLFETSWLLRKPFWFVMAIEPIVTLIALWTDPWHNLFFAGLRANYQGVILRGGLLFWSNVIYSYLLLLLSVIILVVGYARASGIFRKQLLMVLLSFAITWANSILFVAGLNPLPGADNTPFAFSIASALFAYALFRYRLLDVAPIARSVVIEQMKDGVLVLDANNRIVDINPAGKVWLPQAEIGVSLDRLRDQLPATLQQMPLDRDQRVEVMLEPSGRVLDIQVTQIYDQRRRLIGRLIVWREITEFKRLQAQLQRLANYDPLTGVYNRREFIRLANSELARAQRYQHALSLVLIDIDHFKIINDQFGHHTGDEALICFAASWMAEKRTHDIFARWGGEEFILLLPETDQHHARQLVERVRDKMLTKPMVAGNNRLIIKFSAGISAYTGSETFEQLAQRADLALYQAKQQGRNQTMIAELPQCEKAEPEQGQRSVH
ncbi:MAG: diguanylate cyclase [Chloroflexus sp.]|nr:diguanylate cyclase [Chloroflexus sp.]